MENNNFNCRIQILEFSILKLAGFLLLWMLALCSGKAAVWAAESPGEDMSAASQAMQGAEQDFKQAERDFNQAMKDGGTQKTGTLSWSEASSGTGTASSVNPQRMADPSNPSLYGSPETGYAGTWTDPATGDIITSVIAPTPPVNQNSQSYPMIIEPNVGNWNYSGNAGSGWNGGYPQWPVTPDNPGYGPAPGSQSFPPPPPPPSAGIPGQNFYPSPSLPNNFHPGYRPLRPQRPGQNPPSSWNSPAYNPGQPPAQGGQWQPGNNGWNSGNRPNPGWSNNNFPNKPGNGWNPGNASNGWNRPPQVNPGWSRPPAQGAWQPGQSQLPPHPGGIGANPWGGHPGPSGGMSRPWRGN